MNIKACVIVCIAAALCPAAAAAIAATTIGNISGWSRSGQEVTFNISDGSELRLSVLADDLVRFRFTPNGTFTDNVSTAVVKRMWPVVAFTAQDNGTAVVITTAELVVEVRKSPCYVQVKDIAGSLILSDDPSRRISWDSTYTRVYKSTSSGESYLGMGWRTQPLRRNGTVFTMRNKPTYSDPTVFYGGIPMWYGLRGGDAYAIFFDDASWGSINAGSESSQYMYFQNAGGQVDYYFFYGPAISKILDRYTDLTGRPYMPPKWACGFQQCRWSYTPASDVTRVADEFRNRSIPCDVIYLDIDYMNRGDQLTFKPETFPDPQSTCGYLHSRGFNVVANVSPWLLEGSGKYNAARDSGYLLMNGSSPQRGWHDYVYFLMGAPTGWISWVDFSNSAARSWYAAKHVPFLSNGIDGIWNDLNEPDEFATWPTNVKYSFDGRNVDHNKTSNQYCLLQTDFSYDVLKDQYPGRRPFVLSRGAFAGIQRSATVWSGDNTSDWTNDFKRNIPMGLSMSLCGEPHNGHDIGGFYGYPDFSTKPSGELFARWMEAGVFSAFCRAHHNGDGVRQTYPYCEPWTFGTTVETICRDYIGLRYQLMPYLYSLFYQAHTTGAPIQRPTLYDFQRDANTVYQDYDFMFGPWMLVGPVYTAGATSRSVYLPAGTGWTDWWTGTHYSGGQTVSIYAPLNRLPILVRDGAIIPMGPVTQYADQVPISELNLKLYPGSGQSSFTMFEDDGIGWGYQAGSSALTTYAFTTTGASMALDISGRSGSYVPAARHYLVELKRWSTSPQFVALDGAALTQYASRAALNVVDYGWYYDSVSDVLYARFPDSGADMALRAGTDTTPPTIESFTCTGISSAGALSFRAICSDAGSGMDRVEFSVNGTLRNTVSGAHPLGYDFTWTPSSTGPCAVKAVAFDLLGNSSEATIPFTAVQRLSDMDSAADGQSVALTGALPVTAVFPSGDPAMKQNYAYIEQPDRSRGMRVRTDAGLQAGDALRVMGVLRTVTLGSTAQPERYIDATQPSGGVAVDGVTQIPGALAMSNRSIDSLTCGLFVQLWGRVTASGQCDGYRFYYIDDGSGVSGHDLLAQPGSTELFTGVRVYCLAGEAPAVGEFLTVEGIASLETPANFLEVDPVLRR